MPYVKFTKSLDRFFPDLADVTVEATTVADVVAAVDAQFPGLASYIVDERGALRRRLHFPGAVRRIKNVTLRGKGAESAKRVICLCCFASWHLCVESFGFGRRSMDELILGTRKGLLITDMAGTVRREFHVGVPVSYAAVDPRTDIWWAAVDHGH